MLRRLLALLLCTLAPLGALTGCGGGSDASAQDILAKAFGSKAAVKSGRLTLAVDAQGVSSLNGPLKVNLSGPFATAGAKALPRFDFTLGLTSNGQPVTAGAVSTSDKGWVRFQGQTYSVPDNLFAQFKQGYVQAQKQSDAKNANAPTLSKLGVDPRRWLTDPKKAGDTKEGGVDAYHVTAGVDVGNLLDDVQRLVGRAGTATGSSTATKLTPEQRKQLEASVTGADVDVYSGKDDGQLRKLVVNVRLKTGRLALTLAIGDLNKPVDIAGPASARPLSELTSALQGGGGSGSGAAAPSATPAPATPAAPANSAYLQCTQKAGQDLKKFQACAKLLP